MERRDVVAFGLACGLAVAGMAEAADMTDTHQADPNRLVDQTSPYLLQHAFNPVNWYPWGEEAFEAARRENKPIFLSIGYSTCYWCHVMERESFEDADVAAILNAYFIPVKVDREERPDVDEIYMTAVQLMTQHGGWPLSVWLEPDTLKPFFGGTYFPKFDQGRQPGFMTLLEAIHQAWQRQQSDLQAQASRVAQAVSHRLVTSDVHGMPEAGVVASARGEIMASYDSVHGGYGGAPKFPMPVHLDFLMDTGWDIPEVAQSLHHTLDQMAMGGMYDQIGGGFHRYSTDGQWLVPHFEKMLYDNAMLASVYARSFERTGDQFHRRIAEEVLEWTLREMVDEGGGFWSAQDAESNAREGQSYLWTEAEIRDVLSHEDAALAVSVYGVDKGTNFQDPHHPEDPPSNVLFLSSHPDVLAQQRGMTEEAFVSTLNGIDGVMRSIRDQRDLPATDDKILTGWNGLMIGGMADGGRLLKKPKYIEAARRAAYWIKHRMWSEEKGLRRTARGHQISDIPGFLEDYAFLVDGLLRLHIATEEMDILEWAMLLMQQSKDRFFVESEGWFDVGEGDSSLFVRGRSLYDGAIPSGTSVMIDNMRRLYAHTGDSMWLDWAEEAIRPVASAINRAPRGAARTVSAVHGLRQVDHDRFSDQNAASVGPVDVFLEDIEIASDQAKGNLVLEISSPWHVVLASEDGIIGLQITSGSPEMEISWRKPDGEQLNGPFGSMQVVKGRVIIPLEIQGKLDDARVNVTWQACDTQVCSQPRTLEFVIKDHRKQ